MKLLLLAVVATCTPLATPPAPSDAGAPAPSSTGAPDASVDAAPPPAPPSSSECWAAFSRRKELGCPPPEGSAWLTGGCLQLSEAALQCVASAPNCLAATECR